MPQLQNKIENQTHKQHNFPGEIKNPAPNKQSGNQRVRDKQRKGITHTKKRDNIPFSEKKTENNRPPRTGVMNCLITEVSF